MKILLAILLLASSSVFAKDLDTGGRVINWNPLPCVVVHFDVGSSVFCENSDHTFIYSVVDYRGDKVVYQKTGIVNPEEN